MAGYLKDPRANTFEGWIEAMKIFAKYAKNGLKSRVDTAGEHDIFYLPSEPKPDDVARTPDGEVFLYWEDESKRTDADILDGLGYHWDTDVDCWAKYT